MKHPTAWKGPLIIEILADGGRKGFVVDEETIVESEVFGSLRRGRLHGIVIIGVIFSKLFMMVAGLSQ